MAQKQSHLNALSGKLSGSLRALVAYSFEHDTIIRSLKAALVIGTLLGLINHGQALVSGNFTLKDLVPLLVTYLVPFTVTTYGQVQGKRQRDHLWTNKGKDPGQKREPLQNRNE